MLMNFMGKIKLAHLLLNKKDSVIAVKYQQQSSRIRALMLRVFQGEASCHWAGGFLI